MLSSRSNAARRTVPKRVAVPTAPAAASAVTARTSARNCFTISQLEAPIALSVPISLIRSRVAHDENDKNAADRKEEQ